MSIKPTIIKNSSFYNADCLKVLPTLADNSVDLILTDPPYYKVKSNGWDNQWDSPESFFAWLDEVLLQFWRVLKPNGSLYLFCSPQLHAETELLIKQRFNVLNSIVWAKPSGRFKGCRKEDLRAYFPQTERVVFAEHYGAEGKAKGSSGYYSKCQELKQQVFAPLIEYFKQARESLGVSAKEINQATGRQMCSHWFSYSQWQLPSEEQYAKLQALFKAKGGELAKGHAELTAEYEGLQTQYTELVKTYDELKQAYQNLRRPFTVTKEVPYTDVWTYKPVQHYPGKHPCEKPLEMMVDIINASSRPGDVILDAFMGSNATGKAAEKLNRHFIGIEMEEESFNRVVGG
ncbi:site-specific DNA-methyltransferase [Catenovulum sediminis]|uniref:site-specific DNA-methyltransferase n=1 Tax=Catenovulum sediminis TaxID=1740262 RepID=UPI00117E4644|nr:site-specific DNA-methyltransferase [Catenovulum sediminis]